MARDESTTREARLKAALKANMGRRKIQMRIRAEDAPRAHDEFSEPDTSDPDAQEKSNG